MMLSLRSASAQARHGGGRAGLVDEHQPFGIEIELSLDPRLAPFPIVRSVLLRRMGGLF
jgi:hypothetical protein